MGYVQPGLSKSAEEANRIKLLLLLVLSEGQRALMRKGRSFGRAIVHFNPALCGIITTQQVPENAGPGRGKRTSAAEAVKQAAIYGTAEAVPSSF